MLEFLDHVSGLTLPKTTLQAKLKNCQPAPPGFESGT